MTFHQSRDGAIQQSRRHLDGVARQDAGIETVEPTRFHVVPGAFLNHHMIVNTVALRFAGMSRR